MSTAIQDVNKVAGLAKLEFAPEEKRRLVQQLSRIVEYMNKLSELDTSDVPPTSHVVNLKNVLREDVVEQWLSPDEALTNAPAKRNGYFSVPKVIR